jgi:hypothetical protein
MGAKKLTGSATEADLEANIHAALQRAFPWLSTDSIRHQTKFSFTFGRKKIEIDGVAKSAAEARSDIILYKDERPLAVLELKRAGVPLTIEDDAQGLSYARVLIPSPPLVVVTNGSDLHLLATHSGARWEPKERSEQSFQTLVTKATRVASSDLKSAVETLMGTTPSVWIQAVRHVSADAIQDLTSSADSPARPFGRDFLFPRKATVQVLQELSKGTKLVLLEGPPLSGKSNVLREVYLRSLKQESMAVLYVEGGVGNGILQALADVISRALDWGVTREEARRWLGQVSQSSEYRLVLAIDGLDPADVETRREIEDLSSASFGPALTIILAVDDTTADRIVKVRNGLTESAIGRRALRVDVRELDGGEFALAQHFFSLHRVSFMHGAQAAAEYRRPWVLRAVVGPALEKVREAPKNLSILLPSLLSIDLIEHARERFDDPELRRLFRGVARAVLADSKDQSRNDALILEALEVNLVRRETLKNYLEPNEIAQLIDQGFLKPAIHAAGDPVLYIRIPELLASELAGLLADELIPIAKSDLQAGAKWIAGAASNLLIGDVIAAQAIFDAAHRSGGLPFGLIGALAECAPVREPVPPGSRLAHHLHGHGLVELVVQDNGRAKAEKNGHVVSIDLDGDGLSNTYRNVFEWLILSHLASLPFAIETADEVQRVDAGILLHVGQASIPLRKPGGDPEIQSIPIHDIPRIGSVVCHQAGIVEPVTLSIFRYLAREGRDASEWIDMAIETKSMPLLIRVQIALMQVSRTAGQDVACWANQTLTEKLAPALKFFPETHTESD